MREIKVNLDTIKDPDFKVVLHKGEEVVLILQKDVVNYIHIVLTDCEKEHVFANTKYRIVFDDDTPTLSGTTDESGKIYHEVNTDAAYSVYIDEWNGE